VISKIFLFVFAACVAVNAELTKNDFGNLPLRFEPIPDKSGPARFLARGNGYTLFLSDNGAFLQSPAASVRMKMVGANPSASIMAQQPLPGATNYLIGNDPSKWRTGVTGFARVEYRGIYSGIDLVYYGKEGHLEYDFVIAAGADPRKIRIAFDGAARLALDKNGDLVVSASGQTLSFRRPVLYQIIRGEKRPIAGHYDLHGRQVGFKVSEYDASLPLVIDPVLLYSTFFGGPGDLIFAIATDASGSVYMTGATVGTIPIVNAEQPMPKGATAFITKVNAAGTALIYSTFIGGSGGDYGSGIGVDSSGNAYIAGYTSSRDFPTVNPIQPELRAKTNAFAAKLNAAGSALIYSTYLGGSYFDQANAIAVDSAGNVYVAGSTFSSDFPTVAPFQPTLSGQKAAFVAKVNAAGSALAYSTYLGGSTTTGVNQPQTAATGIAVDSAGSAYVTGNTCTNNFPIVNPFQATNHSYCNVFITKFAPDGAALVYSTYLGGSAGAPFFQAPDDFQCCPVLGGDSSGRIAVDSEGNAYVAGLALSSDFPVVNALQPKLSGVGSAFAAKLNASGSGLIYSTYLGGGSYASGIAVDSAGNAYISGNTGVLVDEFPLVMPIQSVAGGAVVAELNPTGSALVFSTYFGGVGIPPMPFAIAVDSAGNIYLAGEAYSSIPLVNPIQPAPAAPNSLASSSFLAKIGPADAAGLALTPAALDFSNIFLGTSSTQYITLFAAGSQLWISPESH
jgi:Beta-propeller repeat